MKVIICGSRTFNNYQFLKIIVDKCLSMVKEEIEVVSGGANGADKLGEKYANERGFLLKVFPVTKQDWDRHGKKAGHLRNTIMAEYATHCIAFWDGKSRGTKDMIDLATKFNLNLRVIYT